MKSILERGCFFVGKGRLRHWIHPIGCEGSEGSEGKVLKMDRPLAGGFLSLTGLWPEGCGIALWAMSFISRLRRSHQHRVSILSAYLVHPFPLRGTSPRWEACHWIRGSRGSPMNPVPLPPQGETRDMRGKTVSHILHVPFRRFPPLVAGATTFPPLRGGTIKLRKAIFS